MESLMISTPLYTTLSLSPPLSSSKSSFFTITNSALSFNHKTYGSLQVNRRGNKSMGCRCLFGLGVPELVVIAGVSALLFGPKNLPDVGRTIGKTVKSFQQAAKEFETELKKEPDSASDPLIEKPTTANEEQKEEIMNS